MSNPNINPVGTVIGLLQHLKPIDKMPDKRGPRDRMLQETRESAYQDGKEQGYADGFERGRSEGMALAYREAQTKHQVEIQKFVAGLDQSGTKVRVALEQWTVEAEVALAGLALAVAVRLVGKDIAEDPANIASMIRHRLDQVVHASSAIVRLNPFDAEAVQPYMESILLAGSTLRTVELVRDPSILGGCLVETDSGMIDARIDEMVAQALREFRGAA